jgi:DNA-binding MarR family transcriptional regulator
MSSKRRSSNTVAVSSDPLTQELAQTFFDLLIRHRAGFQGVMAGIGLTLPQLHAVQSLAEKPLTMRELANASFCEPSNLTGIIDKLEARGLVARNPDPTDRRIKQVSLTRAGQALRRRLLDRLREPAPWMVALAAEDRSQLLEILRRAIVLAQPPSPAER